ncbi:xanthine dehydrogenase family protein molybdopterin-binding subunit [Iamia sp.]|uniref:xanthine dehydrogenase family protein molybdopterin-binding subunit n=1 Tax=Iamia sp. TaxID=2722710 RepID=UPI002D151D1C|nr:xanthine dehydrogenase family protein molybdopterin-binding subunit [Iamia sp.]HXH59635.1 xanthine dehydrogenase family protein molybdopterin-binding subunit [Iamia sp.]
MTDMLEPRAMGRDRVRHDARAKVTGAALYAGDHAVERPVHLHVLQASIGRGRVTSIDASEASALDGVLTVLTHENAPQLSNADDAELFILQSPAVAFRGQIIGAVLAETPEVARQAAGSVRVAYDVEAHDVDLRADRDDLYAPEEVNAGYATDTDDGDVDAAYDAAPRRVDQSYRTPLEVNNPMEPHATTATWSEDGLTLHDSTQGVHSVRATIAPLFGLDEDQVRVVAPHVGGGFGSKGTAHAHIALAAMAAKVSDGRPVKLAVTRQQMFSLVGHRTATIQRVRLAADEAGHLTAVAHEVVEHTSRIKEYAEQTTVPTRSIYATPNRRTSHRLAPLDVPVPSWMRAPGECPGNFGPEVAIDELAEVCGLDPIELRVRNETDVDAATGLPFSSRTLVECFDIGALRFGWSDRPTVPGSRVVDGWRVGLGVATSTYPVHTMPGSVAKVRSEGEGHYAVHIGAVDIGTGTWTALAQIAADALDVAVECIDLEIGDTSLPYATVAGGSSGIRSWGSAIVEAARRLRSEHGDHPPEGANGESEAADNPDTEQYAMRAFGAQFAEVQVHCDTGEIRVPRMLGVFAVGRIVNPRTARSQLVGGMTMGLSMALHEQAFLDRATGHIVNHDLAEYHIAAHADVADIEAIWVDEEDPHLNPMGTKGIGEIGIVGAAAAIANAAHAATGTRVRELPLTADRYLP